MGLSAWAGLARAQGSKPATFRVIAFFTGKNDLAHVDFVHEANQWFPQQAAQHGFAYDTTSDWQNLNASFLARYQVVVFLDTRPDQPAQRAAFQDYMDHGGAWLGFHFAAFALTPSAYPQNWDWYHTQFLGTGEYAGNTWRPTLATLRVQDRRHPTTQKLPATFASAPNEWYKWTRDLRRNPDIDILLAIDPSSFPLGTGPKPHEIWHEGYYPVAWTNRRYRMVYLNMGHNDMDYEHGTNRPLSSTFSSPAQSQFILQSLLWLDNGRRP
ncbi:hypothetical protein GCM10023172_12710 [Hymenobacter ginsengisoli]|uniref:ThuA-like domain-containing protein n=2 Tax=Hymenobacteraceae TaxID=1853232 RepID=A0ABP8Q5A7_9BACT